MGHKYNPLPKLGGFLSFVLFLSPRIIIKIKETFSESLRAVPHYKRVKIPNVTVSGSSFSCSYLALAVCDP